MNNEKVIDLVSYANDNKPVDFSATVHDLLGQKALDALSYYKQEIAKHVFNPEGYEDSEEESEQELDITDDELDQAVDEIEQEENEQQIDTTEQDGDEDEYTENN